MKKRRKLPFLAALVTVAAVAVGVASATTFDPNGVYSPLGGDTLNQTLPISNTSLEPDCSESANPPEIGFDPASGGVLWHFILTTPAASSGLLRADFSSAGLTVPDVPDTDHPSGTLHWFIITPTFDTLLNASSNVSGGNLNLSHVCYAEKASPQITTVASGEGSTGDSLYDTATLTGGFAPPSGTPGTVTFTLYGPDDSDCSDAIYTDTVDVTWANDGTGSAQSTDNGTPSDGNVAMTAGTYQWIASYSGNDQNNPDGPTACDDPLEASVIAAAVPTVLTELHNSEEGVVDLGTSVPLGTTMHDKATVDGPDALDPIEGDVDFTFWVGGEGDCESGDDESAGNKELDEFGVAHPSDSKGALAAGQYAFSAFFNSGDGDVWQSTGSLCEPFTVDKADTDVDTTIVVEGETDTELPIDPVPHVDLGSTVHDTAVVGTKIGDFSMAGTLRYRFFTGIDCQREDFVYGEAVSVDADGNAADSSSQGPLAAGEYSFNASYSGNDNYEQSDLSECEPLIVDKADLGFRTDIHNGAHQVVTSVAGGTVVHDTATLSNVVSPFDPDLDDITFKFWANGTCTGENFSTPAQGTPESALVARTVDSAPLDSGAYSYKAHYAGDDNYNEADFDCETVSVRSLGKTMGFWGNTNGQAKLPDNPGVTLGIVNGTCSIVVSTKAISKIILPSTLNGVSILTNCTTVGSRDPGINTGSLNTLLAQTLAISFNILYVKPPAFPGTYAGQTVGGLGCVATGIAALSPLTDASTVEQVRDRANYLIANAKLGAPVVTQAQIGAMNTLLGCLNREV